MNEANRRTRTSVVGKIDIYGILFASTLQVGDAVTVKQQSQVLAVMRERAQFWGNEGGFVNFSLFVRPIPQPVMDEQIDMRISNESPCIRVGCLSVLGVSTAVTVQIGSNEKVQAQSRTKHIRQLLSMGKAAAKAGAEPAEPTS